MNRILLFFLFSISTYANECKELPYFKINKENIQFCTIKKSKAIVSKECQHTKCKAIYVFDNFDYKSLELKSSELTGGRNPSTLLCKKMGGKLELGASSLGHQHYFCKFVDNSMISTMSLFDRYQDR